MWLYKHLWMAQIKAFFCLSIQKQKKQKNKHQTNKLLMLTDSLVVRDLAQNFTEFVTVQDIFSGDLSFPIILDLLQLQRLY